MEKSESLKLLEDEMIGDKLLPLRESNLVFGEGNPEAKVVFIGEAPGFHEDRLKRPFVGRGGQLLERLINEIGWRRDQVYITNIVKRRPPENRDPLPEEIEAYRPYLTRQIEIIDPKIIVALGRFAMNYFCRKRRLRAIKEKFSMLTVGSSCRCSIRRRASRKQRNGSIHGDDEKTARCGSYASGNYASERICDEETTSPAIAAFLKLRSKKKRRIFIRLSGFSVNRHDIF